jgi:hypothetical protein
MNPIPVDTPASLHGELSRPGDADVHCFAAAFPNAAPRGRPGMTSNLATTVMAISPPILCACLAGHSGNWDLFERSGSITTAIGLLVASRRYVQYGVVELAMLQARRVTSEAREMLEEIHTAKLGLALSGFGTVIWGWGKYIGWWSFICLLVWALFAARDARRDSRKAIELRII